MRLRYRMQDFPSFKSVSIGNRIVTQVTGDNEAKIQNARFPQF